MYHLSLALIGAAALPFGAFRVRAMRRKRRQASVPRPLAPDFADLLSSEQAELDRYLLYFFTPRCFPCRRLGPRVDRLAAACSNVVKIDAGASPEAADRFGVTETPTLVWVATGRIEHFAVGATGGGELLRSFAVSEGVDA